MMAPLPALQSEQSMGKQVECPHCVPCAGLWPVCCVAAPAVSVGGERTAPGPAWPERGRAGSRFLIRDENTELLRMRQPATATALTAG